MEYLKWSDIRIGTWFNNTFTWDDVRLIDDIIQAGGGINNIPAIVKLTNSLPKKKKKKLITVILNLQNNKFIQNKQKIDSEYKITINDVKLLINSRELIRTIVNIKTK